MTPTDAYVISRILSTEDPLEDSLSVSTSFRQVAQQLSLLPLEARIGAWDGFLRGRPDRDAIGKAVADAGPSGPAPEVTPPLRPANLADIRKVMAKSQWVWKGYIPSARISGIAAFEGVGKTRLAIDLAYRIWFALPWPDSQPPTFFERTPTLWVCADGQQDDLVQAAQALGLPDQAILFNTTPPEPYGGTELDAAEDRQRLEAFISQERPGLVFIDTLTNATSYDLCRATENKAMMTPLRDIAQRTQTTIIPLLHLSRDGQALGRRIKGITRTILQLDCPNPDDTGRLRLWVSKSFAKKPPDLGVTMSDSGNTYDFNPPTPPESGKQGRPPETREKAKQFIRDALTTQNDRIGNEMAIECERANDLSAKTFWRAVDEMVSAGELVKDGGKGTGKQVVLHLIRRDPETTPDSPSDSGQDP